MTIRAIMRAAAAVSLAGAVLTGCATAEKPLYYWGNYQPELYSYYKKQQSLQEQLGKLEETVNQAQSKGEALPPGFNAHLGLLYLQTGDAGKAKLAFQTEETRFPESKPYMDFLLKNKAATAAKPVVATPPKPPLKASPANPAAAKKVSIQK